MLNRRELLKRLIILSLIPLDSDIEALLEESQDLSDTDFIFYIRATFNLYVSNPAASAIIEGISDAR